MRAKRIFFAPKYFMFLFLFFYFNATFSQEIKIIDIMGTNLFLLEDGRKISLANLQTPSLNDTSQALKSIAHDLLQYERKLFLNHRLWIEPSPASLQDSSVHPVHLFEKFLFNRINFNEQLLELGFSSYAPIDSLYRKEYSKAVIKAKESKRGIWNAEDYLLKKRSSVFLGITGSLGHYFDKDYNEHNDIHILETRILIFKPFNRNKFEIKIGQLRNREKGFGACEYGPAHHYAYDAIYRYLIINSAFNFDYIGFGIGFFGIRQIKRGFCDEPVSDFLIPNANFRLGALKKIYLSVEAFNDIHNLWQVGVNYNFNGSFSRIWLGYAGWFFGKSGEEDQRYSLGLHIEHLIKNRFLISLSGQLIPFTSYKLIRTGVGFRLSNGQP